MNLTREQAMAAMEALMHAGYSVHLDAIPNSGHMRLPNHPGNIYRISVPALTHETTDLRKMCDLAEEVGLTCRLTLNAIRFENVDRTA